MQILIIYNARQTTNDYKSLDSFFQPSQEKKKMRGWVALNLTIHIFLFVTLSNQTGIINERMDERMKDIYIYIYSPTYKCCEY